MESKKYNIPPTKNSTWINHYNFRRTANRNLGVAFSVSNVQLRILKKLWKIR